MFGSAGIVKSTAQSAHARTRKAGDSKVRGSILPVFTDVGYNAGGDFDYGLLYALAVIFPFSDFLCRRIRLRTCVSLT